MAHRLSVRDVVTLAIPGAALRGCRVVGIWRVEDLGEETTAPTVRNMARALLAASGGQVATLVVTPGGTPLMLVRVEGEWHDVKGRPCAMQMERAAA